MSNIHPYPTKKVKIYTLTPPKMKKTTLYRLRLIFFGIFCLVASITIYTLGTGVCSHFQICSCTSIHVCKSPVNGVPFNGQFNKN